MISILGPSMILPHAYRPKGEAVDMPASHDVLIGAIARHTFLLVPALLLLSVIPSTVAAQDRVFIHDPESGETTSRMGKILDYHARFLEMETVSGRSTKIATDEVLRIETSYGESYQKGLQLFARHQYKASRDAFGAALAEEDRVWVQRDIVAKRIAIARLLGDGTTACQDFVRLTRSEPEHRHWDIIPIPWGPENPDGGLSKTASEWIESGTSVEKLLGAAWLLNTNSKSSAERVLRELSRSETNEIGQIAAVQLWRLQNNPDDATVASWESTTIKLPNRLRAGPRFLLANALKRREQYQSAATTYLQIRILNKDVLALAPQSLFEAGRSLVELDRNEEAKRVFLELSIAFPDSIWASQIPTLNQ